MLNTYKNVTTFNKYNVMFRMVTDENGVNWFVLKDLTAALGWDSAVSYLRIFHQVEISDNNKQNLETCVLDGETLTLVSRPVAMQMYKEMDWILHAVRHCTLNKANYLHNALYGIKNREDGESLAVIAPEADSGTEETLASAIALIERLEARLNELEDKARFADATEASDECVNVAALARKLTDNGCKVTRNSLFAKLREDGYLSSDESTWNQPTKASLDEGLFTMKTTTTRTGKGGYKCYTVPLVTGKGQVYFVNRYCSKEG